MNVTIKPSILVALRTSVRGGVTYSRVDLSEKRDEETLTAAWQTTRRVDNVAEYDRAKKVRSKVSSLIRGSCAQSQFGLVCSQANESELDAAHAEATALVDAFNASSETIKIYVYVLKGRIASSDEAAAQAIGAEVRDLLDEMKTALAAGDVVAIRAAANAARQLGATLDETTGKKITAAIEEARSAARAIVRRVEQGGEDAANVIQELSRRAIDEARASFIDPAPATAAVASAPASRIVDLDSEADAVIPRAPEATTVEV